MSIKIAHTVQGVRFTQLDSSTQATIQIIIDDTIINNAEASYTSGNLVIRAKSTCNRNHLAAGINTDLPSSFFARVMSSGTTLVTALSQTNLGDSLLQYDTDANLSDLGSCHVVTSTSVNDIITYDTDFSLLVEGTLFHDPEDEVLIIRHSTTGNTVTDPSIFVSQSNNAYGGGNGWLFITGDWTVDSEGYFVINASTTDAWGHTYEVGDAIESRGNSTITGGTQEQRDYIDSIYRHCHRIMAINGSNITISLQDPFDGAVSISAGQIIRRAIYNYGREINYEGRTRYSGGTGLIIAGTADSDFHPAQAGVYNSNDGMLYFRGGTIMSNRSGNFAANVDMKNTRFVATKTNLQIRALTGYFRDVVFVGWGLSNYTGARTFEATLQNSTLIGVLDSNFQQYSLKNLDVSENTSVTDIGADSPNNQGHLALEIINSANGSNIKHMWRTTDNRNSSVQRGALIIKKEVSLNVKNSSGNNISDVKLYLEDNPSSRARDSIIADSDGSFAGAVITVANAEVDSVTGGIKYLYANPLTYNKTTDVNGNIDTFTVTTATQILEYAADDDSARQANGGPYNIPSFSGGFWRESDGAAPVYADWDTDRFGGFYKVDRRSNSNTDADDFTFKFAHYNYLLNSSTQLLKGTGELSVNWVLFEDLLISEPSKTIVDDYIAIIDTDRFYDRAKAYLIDNYAGELSTLVSRLGATIDAGDKNIVLDPSVTDAASAFAFDSGTNTLTIKCTSFTGNLTTTGAITVNSGVTILGTIIDINNPAGLSSRTFNVSNVILGTTIQIYNETQVTKRGTTEGYTPTNVYETLIASGTTTDSTLIGDGSSTIAQLITAAGNGLAADPMADTSYVLPSGWKLETTEVVGDNNRVTITGIYDEGAVPNGDFNIGDSVRIRATCAASTGAFLPFVNTTIANEGGFSMRVVQQADTIYNDNGIDGSASDFDATTLTIAPDYTNFEIDVTDSDDPGVVTVQQIYAKYAYLITTTQGIENFFGAITAENPTNFRINVDIIDLKIQNIGTSDMIITGARLYRSDFTTVVTKGPNGGTLSHDTGELVQFIRPQVESAIDFKDLAKSTDTDAIKTDTEAVKKKTNLIPGLL